MNCSNPIADLERRKWEIMKELERFKNKIIDDLSGVDKETLTDLRKLFHSLDLSTINEKFRTLEKLIRVLSDENGSKTDSVREECLSLIADIRSDTESTMDAFKSETRFVVDSYAEELNESVATITGEIGALSADLESLKNSLVGNITRTGGAIGISNQSPVNPIGMFTVKTGMDGDTIQQIGLNLVDFSTFATNNGWYKVTENGFSVLKTTVGNFMENTFPIPKYLFGKSITISCEIMCDSDTPHRLRVKHKNGDYSQSELVRIANQYVQHTISFTVQEGDVLTVVGTKEVNLSIRKLMFAFSASSKFEEFILFKEWKLAKAVATQGRELTNVNAPFTLVSLEGNEMTVVYKVPLNVAFEELQSKIQ